MKQLFENWRRYQLNEIFTSPVPKEEITFKQAGEDFDWYFKVGKHKYIVSLTTLPLPKSIRYNQEIRPYFKIYELSFGRRIGVFSTSFSKTNFGLKTGMKVMSTVISVIEEWIKNHEFAAIHASADGVQRAKLYDRVLKTTYKNIGSDYEMESRVDQAHEEEDGEFYLYNIGALEREVDQLVQRNRVPKARKLISATIELLEDMFLLGGPIEKRIINKSNELQRIEGTTK